MAKMRAVQVAQPGAPFELVERDVPEPGYGEVRIKVQACGVCHSDAIAKEGWVPGIPYPIIPGHEVAGVIEVLGEGVIGWDVGTRVGVGWFGGNCGHCEPCRRGQLINCQNIKIPGLNFDGGYAEAMVAPASGLVRIPDDLSAEDAAPLLCAGVTTYNALRQSGAEPGDVVAVLGLGGLGHLGVQFAAKMGFRTVAIARGPDKAEFAKKLGAHVYIDSAAEDAAAELAKLGGAKTILATVPNSQAMSQLVAGLAVRGVMVIVGVGSEPLQFSAMDLIPANRTIKGHPSGASIDSEDTLNFSVLTEVRPMIEVMPLEEAAAAYDKMMAAKARFRMVLTTGA
ncbi:alcohol dehydrogenase [Acuticoccus sediminis]|uniref:Alcohol dehydrogenase n=1 Tax=Acuticoccus sediminis TaxID=2184697 RepID=A0A8B2NM93_9HYPH|nr:alcohol dehydrogenase [Acuticoccus sediminis]RAH96394.1 alcohol dehydrogenase [Acuticoccus sediminis]